MQTTLGSTPTYRAARFFPNHTEFYLIALLLDVGVG